MVSHLKFLTDQFGGAAMVRPVAAGRVIGLAKPTVYNRVSAGSFPLPLVETATGKMVRLLDIAEYLDSLQPILPVSHSSSKPKGRPRKREQVEAQRRGVSIQELRSSGVAK